MADVDFVEEIHIAQFWRRQLGEYEYVGYNPDDLRRWYVALELRGPEEVRNYLVERTGRHPRGMVTGLVGAAPHPPLDIVELWLRSHDRVRTAHYWMALAAFFIFVTLSMPYLHGCSTLQDPNRVATRPLPMSTPLQPGQFQNGPPPATATQPSTPAAPAAPSTSSSTASPGTGAGAGGPQQ